MTSTPVAIVLAVLSACGLAFGAMFQHRGVTEQHGTGKKFGLRAFFGMFTNKQWVWGMTITVVGVICGTLSLALAAVMVVQPVGAISLVISVLLAQKTRGLALNKRIIAAVAFCTVGVAAFVFVSAIIATPHPQLGTEALPLVWFTGIAVGVSLVVRYVIRRPVQLVYVVLGGILFACVATNTHMVSVQFLAHGLKEVTWPSVVAIVAAGLVGSVFVQAAYACGPPEIVIAGLTVIDPIVAVFLGAVLLGEAAMAPLWAVSIMCVIGAIACISVVILSRYHPEVRKSKAAIERRQMLDTARTQAGA